MTTIEEFEEAKTKVMKYLLYKKRTEREVKNKFAGTIEEELLQEVIDYVKEAGYLNETQYIDKTVKEYMALKTLSIKELQYKLYAKGVDKELMEEYFYSHESELWDYELASAKKIGSKKQGIMDLEELQDYFKKKGYHSEIIKEVIESCKQF